MHSFHFWHSLKTPFVHLVKFFHVGCKFCSDLLLNTLHYTPKWREISTPLPTLFGLCNKWKTKIIVSLQLSRDEKYCTMPITLKFNLYLSRQTVRMHNMLLILPYTVCMYCCTVIWYKPILETPCNHMSSYYSTYYNDCHTQQLK